MPESPPDAKFQPVAFVAARLAAAVAREASDFEVDHWEGRDLVIIGSFDLAYYYDVELTFLDVFDLDLPFDFHRPVLREATTEEASRREPLMPELGEALYALDLDGGRTALIGAMGVNIREGHFEKSPQR